LISEQAFIVFMGVALTFKHYKPVGARLAGDGDFEGAIAGKPCSYRGKKHP